MICFNLLRVKLDNYIGKQKLSRGHVPGPVKQLFADVVVLSLFLSFEYHNTNLVRALYDFNSNDASSLSFRKNDIIQVLTQLESGWWDGFCNGERGWFPSNYVTTYEADDDDEHQSDWITQETPDGEIFYYNVRTQESTWDLPADDNESVTTTRSTTRDNSSVHGGSSTNNHHSYTHRAADSPRSGSISSLRPPRQLPEDWIQQPTEDGTTYYYLNTKTQEIRWTYPGGGSNGDTMLGNGNNNGDDNMDYNEPSVTMNGTSHSTANNNVVESSSNNSDDIGEIKDDDEEEANESLSSNNINHHHRTNSSRVEEAAEQYKQVREEDNDENDKESIASSKGSRLSISTFDTYQHLKKDANGDEIQLPPNWGSKMTPQGRIYYFNKLTDETTWSLDNVDMDTGQLLTKDYGEYENNNHHHEISDIIDEHHQMNKLHIQPMAALPPSPPQRRKFSTASKTSGSIPPPSINNSTPADYHLQMRQLLQQQQQQHQQEDMNRPPSPPYNDTLTWETFYTSCTNSIVERIRIMLYASGTVEKESPAIRQNCTLKICHRHILTSLSKLVLSTKVASGVWPPPDAAQKMKNDADEVLVAVRQFVQAAEHTVEIKRVDPQILESANGGAWRGNNLPPNYPNNGTIVTNGKYSNGVAVDDDENKGDSTNGAPHHTGPTRSLTPDLLASLDHISRTVAKAITLLLNHIRKTMDAPRGAIASNAAFAPQLIAQTRQVVTQAGQFLNLIEDINLEDLDETSQNSIKEFKIVKQALYNSIAGLVMCTQHATDPSAPHNAMEQVLTSTNLVDKSVKDVIIATKFLVEEKDAQDQRRMQASMKRRSSNTTASTTSTLIINDDSRKSNGNAEDLYEDIDSDYGTGLPTVPEGDVIHQQSNNNIGGNNDDFDELASPLSEVSYSGNNRIRSDSALSSNTFEINNTNNGSANGSNDNNQVDLYRSHTQPHPSSPPNPAPSTSKLGASGTKSPRDNKKIRNFFGEDSIPTALQTSRQREDKPWFLGYDFQENDLIFNMEQSVKGGTLSALVERLTMHDLLDSNFIATFLLTYRSFTTTDEFFNLLVKRFMIQPPDNLTPEEIEIWQEKKQTPVRLRVFNIMKSWLENYYIDDQDSHCLEKMRDFAQSIMHEHMSFAAVSLIKVIEKRQQQPKETNFRDMVLTNPGSPPASILPKNMKKLKFLDLDPLELARQLTIIESKLYNKIRPVECLNKAWSKETKEEGEIAENIKAMIVNSNQ
ncbi:56_t:CDS:2, partial [Ambispora leptoticha]